jgi:crossover junction endodeoxyribonuclease RuvC
MFVLGIDPGLTRCGFGLVESSFEDVEAFRAVRAGVIESPHQEATELRLGHLHQEIASLIADCSPDAVVVEKVFFQKNANTAIPVAQASGVAVGLAASLAIPVRQFTAQQVKMAVTGYGAAKKPQVQSMVALLCGLSEVPRPPDAADALALAMTYFIIERVERRYPVGQQ